MAEPSPDDAPAALPSETSTPAHSTTAFWNRNSVRFGAAFFGLWLVFGWLALQLPTLPDTDSYYHLGIARIYAYQGVVDQLPWLRFSLLQGVEGVGFGDKELLFHLLLAPFTYLDGEGGGTDGGRWALAFWNALAVTTLAAVGRMAVGRWGLLVPCVLWLGSLDFLGRLIRLRPETPAMILFVVAAVCAGTRRYRLLGLVMLVFTLTYTAFHALLGLCFLWFLWQAWQQGQDSQESGVGIAARIPLLPWQGLAYPVLGSVLGLFVHPHFPQNIVLWKTQSIDFFRYKDQLDVGTEIGAQTTDKLLLNNLPWFAACVILLMSALAVRRTGSEASEPPKRLERRSELTGIADALTIAAGCFGVLYLLMMRFSTHALPLLTLALLFRLAVAGRRPGPILALPGGLRLPTTLALVLALGVGAWRGGTQVYGMATAPDREVEWATFGQAIPAGAHVAAPWGQTPQYFFWAPTAFFLNDLDPVFMAVPFPEAYRLQRSVFDGTEPDVPMALAAGLDSEYLAMSRFLMPPLLATRLTGDPRAQRVYNGWNLLYRMTPLPAEGQGTFLVDWHLVPQGSELPVPATTDVTDWDPYPRIADPALRELEAYVDGRRIERSSGGRPSRCFAVTRDLPRGGRFELAAAGPTTLWSQRLSPPQEGPAPPERIQILDSPGAILGRGVVFSMEAEPDEKLRLSAVSCLAEPSAMGAPNAPQQIGFYLRRLGR